MDIFSVLTLLGGLAMFLYGMHTMSGGLEKLSGGKLQSTLQRMTSNTFKSLAFGAGVTIAIQSSSALTVMLVGLVNSGILNLEQTTGMIMGSNIGTTLTAWILSLAGINSSSVLLSMLKPENFSPVIALIGVIMIMVCKTQKRRDMGGVMVGFAILMFGMTMMGDAVAPLKDIPEFASILTSFNNPVLGVLVGMIFTGIIQSSAASMGILQALSLTGMITYGMAIPVVMGLNIGTCVTALISSIGTSKNARRVAIIHIMFNMIGTVLGLIVFYGIGGLLGGFPFLSNSADAAGIALCHSVFNAATTFVLLPFGRQLVALSRIIIPVGEDERQREKIFLDERLLLSPGMAVHESFNMACAMASLAKDTVLDSLSIMQKYDVNKAEAIKEGENELDTYEDKLGSFLVKAAACALNESDSRDVSKLLHSINDFERIGDHALNIKNSADEMKDKALHFSAEAKEELSLLFKALNDVLSLSIDSFVNNDLEKAAHANHISRVWGILNGTTNYIMDAMHGSDADFADVLAQAQALGYAEADPSADIDGLDIQRKLILSANVAFGVSLREADVPVFGIRNVRKADIARFQAHGCTCKLIAAAEQKGGSICAYVEPTLLGHDALEAAVPANFNLISMEGDRMGVQSFFGQGAGRYPTAYNVVQDLVDIRRGVHAFYTDSFVPAVPDNSGVQHRYYVRTRAALPELAALAEGDWDGAVITQPVPVSRMHALMAQALVQDSESFFAALQ